DEERVRAAVTALRSDQPHRARIAVRGPELVDGAGARRVARVMTTGPLQLRVATMADADLLLRWRNDPVTRAASFDTAIIERGAHRRWLEERLANAGDRLWIGMLGGRPAGVVRFAVDADGATASVTVAPEHRGRGVATRLIVNGCARLAAESRARGVDAWIRPENVASIGAFGSAGFRLAQREADRLRFRLELAPVP
ncbi:MAG: GNAT family N-acetyltransferase, partial [Chloroflexota bacterium]|nr:GNAT family N-acetyltransferase [Chloroflexota bacterium]